MSGIIYCFNLKEVRNTQTSLGFYDPLSQGYGIAGYPMNSVAMKYIHGL